MVSQDRGTMYRSSMQKPEMLFKNGLSQAKAGPLFENKKCTNASFKY